MNATMGAHGMDVTQMARTSAIVPQERRRHAEFDGPHDAGALVTGEPGPDARTFHVDLENGGAQHGDEQIGPGMGEGDGQLRQRPRQQVPHGLVSFRRRLTAVLDRVRDVASARRGAHGRRAVRFRDWTPVG